VTHPWNHQSVKANGVQMHFVRHGEGTPLLMLHGWPGFWFDWNRNIPELAQHFDCIAPDMRGFGYSEKPDLAPEFGYNDGTFAADVLEFLNELGLTKVNLIAHDFGCLWAQRFVRSHPERVNKLIMFNPPYLGIGQRWREPQHGPNFWYQYFHNLDWSHELVASSRQSIELYISHFLSHWPHKKSAFTDDEKREYYDAFSQPGAVKHGFDVYRSVFRGGNQIILPETRIITHPTLVLWGEEDVCVPIRWADRLGEFFANIEFVRVPGCGHFPFREDADFVHPHIISFLKAMKPSTVYAKAFKD
jgi:pimeloyl-ACP methyl ester carboxylesterase